MKLEDAGTAGIMSSWYALNPAVRRLWAYEAGDDARDIHVVVALAPVADSDEIGPIWLAKCAHWQWELQRLVGRRVYLDWFDEGWEPVPCTEERGDARVCLTSIGWRDCCSFAPGLQDR